jgi:hypothetical protein
MEAAMTLTEFKAWFSGYEEGIETTPTEKQWARIKQRVAEIDNMPTTQTVFVDRYYRDYYRQPIWMQCSGVSSAGAIYNNAHPGADLSAASHSVGAHTVGAHTVGEGAYTGAVFDAGHTHPVWNSAIAMNVLGHEDAKADAA